MRQLRLLLALTLAEDACCVDVGANIGAVLREIVTVAPFGRHVAYEPLPELATLLAREFPSVEVRHAAASDHAGEATFHRVRGREARSSLDRLDFDDREIDRFTVALEDLDSCLPHDLAPALIKIDVEGAEEQVLRGAARTLATHRPTVVLEHNASARYFGTSSQTIHAMLAAAGLRVFDIDGNGPYTPDDFDRTASSGRMWTFVAHP
jgi:FkbM family methyltransferase